MPLPGTSESDKVLLLLRRMIADPEEVFQFAVAATSPKDGQIALTKKDKFKKKDVRSAAEADAKKDSGGKPVKLDVMIGMCRLDKPGAATLRLIVYGKAPAKAVACAEHLLVRGDFKAAGFKGIILEELPEDEGDDLTKSSVSIRTTGGTTTPPSSDLESIWKARLAEWSPTIKAALVAKRPDSAEIAKFLAQATAHSKPNGDMEQALNALAKCYQLAASEPSGSVPTRATSGDATARLKQLLQRQKELFATDPDARTQVLPIAQWAAQLVTAGKAEAVEALDKLELAINTAQSKGEGVRVDDPAALDKPDLESASSVAEPAPGLVQKRRFLLERWQKIPPEVHVELQKLKQAIQDALPGEDADGLMVLAEDYLDDLCNDMKDAIDDDINSGDPQYKAALNNIAAWRTKIAKEPLIQHLKVTTLNVELSVESIFLNALLEVEQNLAG